MKRDIAGKRLRDMLSRANDEEFVRMVWAIDAIQSKRPHAVRNLLQFPKEIVTSDMASKYSIHKWELETLVTQLLLTPKMKPKKDGLSYRLRCDLFESMRSAINVLRDLEGAEAGIYLNQRNVFNEMHRIAHRTFPWQRGFINRQEFYRAAFIYGHGRSSEYFQERNGIDVGRFILVGFLLHSQLMQSAAVRSSLAEFPSAFPRSAIPTAAEWERSVALLTCGASEARTEARLLRDKVATATQGGLPTAFQPSLLRSRPIIAFGSSGERLSAPLPTLIGARITSGLYYDMQGSGASEVRNAAADRFEQYSRELITAFVPGLDAAPPYKFRLNNRDAHTPDVLVRRDGSVVLAIECKATKLTIGAQYFDDPFAEARQKYAEIVKGVVQLWRFFSLTRRGVLTKDPVASDAMGMVLAHDAWLTMSSELRKTVLDEASKSADGDENILPDDRRAITFTNIVDLELTLAQVDEEGFLRSVAANATEEHKGWSLADIPKAIGVRLPEAKPYPFDPGALIPWMILVRDAKQTAGQTGMSVARS